MHGTSGAVLLERTWAGGGEKFGFGERGVVGACCARRREERPIRLLRRVREVPLKRESKAKRLGQQRGNKTHRNAPKCCQPSTGPIAYECRRISFSLGLSVRAG
jgi:hypothetical protein